MPSSPLKMIAVGTLFSCLSIAGPASAQVTATDEGVPGNVEGTAELVEEQTMPSSPPGRAEEVPAEAAEAQESETEGAAAARLSPSEAKKVEEIVVSARRRSELLEETPISVTVLSDQRMQSTNTTQLNQIQNLVPNLQVYRTGNGQTVSIVTRGVGNFPFVYYDQGTGLYVDGVFLSRNAGNVLDIVDMQQIEVLRGPQGTLFGKNNLGGAVSITTVKPQPELDAYASVSAGSFGTVNTKAMVNVPILEDKLFTRFNFASFKNDGYFTNTLQNVKQSNRNSQDFLVATRFLPNDRFTIDVTGSYAVSHSQGLGAQCVVIPEAFADLNNPLFFNPADAARFKRQCEESSKNSGRFMGQSDVARLVSVQSYGVWSIANYDVGPVGILNDLGFKFTNSWRQQVVGNRDDLDGTASPIANISTAGGGNPYDGSPNWQNQIQNEVQVSGTTWQEKINFVGGLFLYWEKARTDNGFRFFTDSPSPLVQAAGNSLNFVDTYNNDWALFAQATADFTDWMSLTAGVRYTSETKRLGRLLLNPLNPQDNPLNPDPVTVDFNGKLTSSAWTPMVNLAMTMPQDWLADFPVPVDHFMGYFTYSQGFRGGGFNGGARTQNPASIQPFLPETINSYEIGFKTILFDGRGLLNFSAFIANRDNQQVPQIITYQPDPLVPPTTDVLTRNASSSTSNGIEVEFLGQPIDGMRVDGSMGFFHGVYGDFPGAQNARTGATINRKGQQFTFVPRWQTHLGVQYSFEMPDVGVAWLNGWLTPRVDWSFQSQTQYWVPELPELLQPNRNIVNVRISYGFNDNQSQIAFWGTNMTNQNYFQETVAIPRTIGVVTRYWQQPRAMGVEVIQNF